MSVYAMAQNSAAIGEMTGQQVATELQLNEQETAKVKKIYADAGAKIENIFNSSIAMNQKAAQINNVIAQMDKDSKAVIPAAKHAQYDAVVAKMRNKPGAAGKTPTTTDVQTSKNNLKALLKTELGVTDDVAQQLADMTVNDAIKKKEIQQQYKNDPQTKAKLIKEINMNAKAKLDQLLNDEQKVKLLQVLQKYQGIK